ncbi:hypothetical protein HDU99_007989, partial [Rhizoclosmatium hyalinum]
MKELHRTDSSLGGKGRAASGSQHSVPGLARTFSASSNNSHSNSVLGSKRDLWELGQLKPDPLPPNQPNHSDQKTRTFFDFDVAHSISQPFVRADPPIRAASVPVQPRRNDIFFMDHAVTKPVLKMTEEEVKALETHPTPAPKHYGSQSSHNPDWRSAASETFSRYDLPSPTTSSSALRNVRQSDPVEQSTPSTRTPRGFVDLDQEPSTEYSRAPPVLPTTQGFIPLRSATAPVGMDISFPITLASEKIMPIT